MSGDKDPTLRNVIGKASPEISVARYVKLLPTLLTFRGRIARRSNALSSPVLIVPAAGRSHSNNTRRRLRPSGGGVVGVRQRAPRGAAHQGRTEDSSAVYVRLREITNTTLEG